jgi:peroxiredoxin
MRCAKRTRIASPGLAFAAAMSLAAPANAAMSPNEWALPVSATYVIDSDGSIVYAYMDVDYRERADPRDVLAVLMRKAAAA